jgi:hypothetical protein
MLVVWWYTFFSTEKEHRPGNPPQWRQRIRRPSVPLIACFHPGPQAAPAVIMDSTPLLCCPCCSASAQMTPDVD